MNSRNLIFIIAITCLNLIFAQNDDQKDVEWSENDPRWISKVKTNHFQNEISHHL